MRRIDELHMEYAFTGSRIMKGLLRQVGFAAGRLHVTTCRKTMGIEALYRKPNTSKSAPVHKIYQYLLRKLAVTRPNQVWAMDILPTSPWSEGSFIWSPFWTGSAGRREVPLVP